MKKLLVILFLSVAVSGYSQTTEQSGLFKFINEWIGRPYKLGGKSEFGIDCSNFVARLYKDVFGKAIEGTCYYLWQQTNEVKNNMVQVGDLIFFNSPLSPSGWHVGVYIGNDQFVHAANRKEGVKVSCLFEPYYKNHFKGVRRL